VGRAGSFHWVCGRRLSGSRSVRHCYFESWNTAEAMEISDGTFPAIGIESLPLRRLEGVK
jgi:hypothetical protein